MRLALQLVSVAVALLAASLWARALAATSTAEHHVRWQHWDGA